jgi:hypothetical protein
MQQLIVHSDQLNYLCENSGEARWARACFRAAVYLRLVEPGLVFAGATILVVLSTACPAAAQTGGPIISGGNPNAPITGIQNLVTLGVWLLIAAGIGGIGWALINGMRRQAWGAQLIFGAACLGFGGIVALWNEYANGRSAVLPAF